MAQFRGPSVKEAVLPPSPTRAAWGWGGTWDTGGLWSFQLTNLKGRFPGAPVIRQPKSRRGSGRARGICTLLLSPPVLAAGCCLGPGDPGWCQAPHLLQGLYPLFQEPVLRPKPLWGDGGEGVRAPSHSCTHGVCLSPRGPGHLQAGCSQRLMFWVSDSRKQGQFLPNGSLDLFLKNKAYNVMASMDVHSVGGGQ